MALARGLLVGLMAVGTLAGCTSGAPAPSPADTATGYTAYVSTTGNPVRWRLLLDGNVVRDDVVRPSSTAPVAVAFEARPGQQVVFLAEVQGPGYAGCQVLAPEARPVVANEQDIAPLRRAAPASCAFVAE